MMHNGHQSHQFHSANSVVSNDILLNISVAISEVYSSKIIVSPLDVYKPNDNRSATALLE